MLIVKKYWNILKHKCRKKSVKKTSAQSGEAQLENQAQNNQELVPVTEQQNGTNDETNDLNIHRMSPQFR